MSWIVCPKIAYKSECFQPVRKQSVEIANLQTSMDRPDAIIFAHPRSGTHFLQASLSSHTKVHSRGEFLIHYERTGKEPREFIFFNKPNKVNIAIVMYAQLPLFEYKFGSLEGSLVIHMIREPAAVALSLAQMKTDRALIGAKYEAHTSVRREPLATIPFLPGKYTELLTESVQARQAFFSKYLETISKKMKVTYEQFTLGKQTNYISEEKAGPLLTFLGLESCALTNNLRKGGTEQRLS